MDREKEKERWSERGNRMRRGGGGCVRDRKR